MQLSLLPLTILLITPGPITAMTEAAAREKGDCALGVLNLDSQGQVTGCGNPLIPIGYTGDYKGIDGKL